jgi:hypothetical protein
MVGTAGAERMYALAKAGEIEVFLEDFFDDAKLTTVECTAAARFQGNNFTTLHQMAFWGSLPGCQACVLAGADLSAVSKDGLGTPSQVARSRGHEQLAALLDPDAASVGRNWEVSGDKWAASSRFGEAKEATARRDMEIACAGGTRKLSKGGRYFQDALGRVLVGWHGTTNPPRGMDGESEIGGVE